MDRAYWNRISNKMDNSHLEKHIAAYKAKSYQELIERWTDGLDDKLILKTDLFEECFGIDSFLNSIGADEVFAIDISPEIVKRARNQADDFNFKVADIEELPFSDKKFDLIISSSTLDNVERRKVPKALEEFNRVLKPEGNLILTLDNYHNYLYRLGLSLGQGLGFLPFFQDKCYSIYEAEELLSSAGFQIEKIDSIFHVLPPFSHILGVLAERGINTTQLSKVVLRLSEIFERSGLRIFTGRLLSFNAKKVA